MFKKILLLFINSYVYSLNFNIQNNLDFINNHNNNNNTYKLELNQFINNIYINEFTEHNIINIDNQNNISYNFNDLEIVKDNIDWRNNNKVSSVKNQGECGSCWAFSSVEAVESAWAIKNNRLYNLSEQQVVDCSTNYGNNGCNGGSMVDSFKYIIENGLCNNESYPYIGIMNQCNTSCNKIVNINSYQNIKENDEDILKKALNVAPISVAIQANKRSFQFYKSGIYSDLDCGFELDHGVLLIGYGTDQNLDYWIVKNSWGENWGENGYIRLLRNIDDNRGLCGISMTPSRPLI